MAPEGTDGGLVDAVKALSQPITKLIEVMAAGCGKVYEPTHIRRASRAEADALVIMEEARSRATEISVRAAKRVLDIETRRQENIEAIAQIAQEQLPNEVSEDPVDQDWATRFVREAQDVSNEGMRMLWGKLLAGEVARPGSFSPATLQALAVLPRSTALTFTRLCDISAAWLPPFDQLLMPLVLAEPFGSPGVNSLSLFGLSYQALSTLVEAGLISGDFTAYNDLLGASLPHCIGDQHILHTPEEGYNAANKVRCKVVNLTAAGRELRTLVTITTRPEYLERYETWAIQQFKVKIHRVTAEVAKQVIAPAPKR
jgi:uncharacterized repeat protein (TIGR03899 family)